MKRGILLMICCLISATLLWAEKPVNVESSEIEHHIKTKPKLEFPEVTCGARVMGTVVLDVIINRAGDLVQVKVVSGPMMLQEYTIKYIRQWKFEPFIANGHAVSVHGTVSITIDTYADRKQSDTAY